MIKPKAALLVFSESTVREDVYRKRKPIADREVEIRVLDWNWSEKAVRYLDWVAPVLLMLGILGIIIELKTPGFGFFGLAGLALVAVFFFGKYTAGLAEVWEILLFVVGVALLAVLAAACGGRNEFIPPPPPKVTVADPVIRDVI